MKNVNAVIMDRGEERALYTFCNCMLPIYQLHDPGYVTAKRTASRHGTYSRLSSSASNLEVIVTSELKEDHSLYQRGNPAAWWRRHNKQETMPLCIRQSARDSHLTSPKRKSNADHVTRGVALPASPNLINHRTPPESSNHGRNRVKILVATRRGAQRPKFNSASCQELKSFPKSNHCLIQHHLLPITVPPASHHHHNELHSHPLLPRPPGHCPRRDRLPGATEPQHHRQQPIRRPDQPALLHARALQG